MVRCLPRAGPTGVYAFGQPSGKVSLSQREKEMVARLPVMGNLR